MTTEPTLAKVQLTEGLGPLPPQREGQYLTMTICGTKDDPAECGHWSSPAHVQWRIDKAVTEDRERCAKLVEQVADDCDEWRPLDGSRGVALRAANHTSCGCPECVRALRTLAREQAVEIQTLRDVLNTAGGALFRLAPACIEDDDERARAEHERAVGLAAVEHVLKRTPYVEKAVFGA